MMIDNPGRWVPVEGWPYEVSDNGRVRRVPENRVLTPRGNKNGRLTVRLCHAGKQRNYYIHRLVATAFVGPCPPGEQCNHVDGVPTNNRAENLEWVTIAENHRHAAFMDLVAWGEGSSQAKLTVEKVIEMRLLYRAGATTGDLARQFGISISNARRVATGKTWNRVPYAQRPRPIGRPSRPQTGYPFKAKSW